MIQANELRIGNLVKLFLGVDKEGEKYREYSIHGVKINESRGLKIKIDNTDTWFDLRNFEPIPLTEEWLLRFGFEKGIDKVYYIKSKFIYIKVFEKIGHILLCRDKYCDHIKISDDIKNVHQLQNLYFALTNKELNYAR